MAVKTSFSLHRNDLASLTALLAAACCAAPLAASAEVTADFTQTAAKFRPALHSSGFAPTFNRRHSSHWDEHLKEMNFEYVRSHDLGLVFAK